MLYTRNMALPIHAYILVGVNKVCLLHWTGINQAVFRISSQKCAGYEIGWDFIQLVKRMGCNLSSYSHRINVLYKTQACRDKFMSPSTFRKCFFSWASHQDIDFRKQCNWCWRNPKILACDGINIRIAFHNCNVNPIELPGNSDIIIPTKHKINVRSKCRRKGYHDKG